jgi:hypothetical protein
VVDDDDPVDTVFGLEQGLRLVEEDYAYRGQVRAQTWRPRVNAGAEEWAGLVYLAW